MAAHLEDGEHQRRQLVAEGDAGEADLDVGADPADGEGGAAVVVVGPHDGDVVGQRGELVEQRLELGDLGQSSSEATSSTGG